MWVGGWVPMPVIDSYMNAKHDELKADGLEEEGSPATVQPAVLQEAREARLFLGDAAAFPS